MAYDQQQFSAEVSEILISAGWTPTRCVPIPASLQQEKSFTEPLHPVARELIQSFNGLKLRGTDRSWVEFNAAKADYLGRDDYEYLSRAAGRMVGPAGTAPCSDFFVDSLGRIVLLDMDWVFVNIHENLNDFLEANLLWRRDRFRRIPLSPEQMPKHMRET
jgi:hypothetical protein